jgi:hypothetical protein
MIAAKSGLTRKVGNGKGQQTGAVKPRNRIRFIGADNELRLKQELKKTPTAETNSMLLTINNAKGKIAVGGIQPARLKTMTWAASKSQKAQPPRHEPMILPKTICFSVSGVVSRMGQVWASFSEVMLVAAEVAVRNKPKKK